VAAPGVEVRGCSPSSLSFPFFLDLSHFPSLQCIFYTPVVWGKTASFGGRYRGLGAVPTVGSRSRAPGQGVWWQSPSEADSFLFYK